VAQKTAVEWNSFRLRSNWENFKAICCRTIYILDT
jgi:hypothetical protein